jgi:ABC-type nitrate/sulfonate/bicarbonate transport system substrate-binding protein
MKAIHLLIAALVLALLAGCSQPAPTAAPQTGSGAPAAQSPQAAGPVLIRYGRQPGAEEPLWVIPLKPEIAPNYGKAYTLEFVPFRANAERMQAYQAGQLDGGGITVGTSLLAKLEGVDLKLVGSIFTETKGHFLTTAYTLTSSGIPTPADMKGKRAAIVDFRSSTDLWTREALKKVGLNPDRDVEFAVLPFPAQAEALRSGKVDMIMLTQPWASLEDGKGDLTVVYTSVDALGFDHEAGDIFLRPSFIQQNREAVRAFLSDYVRAIKWWEENRLEGTKLLIEGKYLQGDPDQLAKLSEYNRPANGKIDVDSMKRVQDLMVGAGWMSGRINIDELIDNSLLPQ